MYDLLLQLRILEYAKKEMHDRALQSYVEVGEDDEELGPAHWPSVQKLVTYLRQGSRMLHTLCSSCFSDWCTGSKGDRVWYCK